MNVSVTKRFNAPPNVVWAVLTDLENAPQRISAIKRLEILTKGPVGKGTRWRETRIMFKREATEKMEITEWNPPRSYTVEANSCGAHFKSTITCEHDPNAAGGTLVTFTMMTKPLTFMAKLMSPLGVLMKGACVKAFEKDLDDLKRSVESGPAAQPA